MTDQPDTLWLWNKVQKTDTRDTKQVSFGRKFTAIDAYAQIRNATALWGPLGYKWYFKIDHHVSDTGQANPASDVDPSFYATYALADATLFYPDTKGHGSAQVGPIRGCAPLCEWDNKNKRYRHDHDAPKKATTDAMTKCLSYVGFNADVFLGRFDDNKYVQQLKREEAEATKPAQPTPPDTMEKQRQRGPSPDDFKDHMVLKNTMATIRLQIDKCKTPAQLDALRDQVRPTVRAIPREQALQLRDEFDIAAQAIKESKP